MVPSFPAVDRPLSLLYNVNRTTKTQRYACLQANDRKRRLIYGDPAGVFRRYAQLARQNYSAFERAFFSQPPVRGLRVNTLKLTPEAFSSISPYPLTPSPLCRDSFLLDSDARVGLHPFHHAGLFYMQEPSASAVVEALDPSPGTMVLDSLRGAGR